MIRIVNPGPLEGTLDRVMTSKSQAHRLMICAAQAEEETLLRDVPPSEDAETTLRCLEGMGAKCVADVERLVAGEPPVNEVFE